MNRILVAIDGSEESRRALSLAVKLAQTTRKRLTLAHAAPAPASWATGASNANWVEFHRSYEQYAEKLLTEAARELAATGVELDTLVLHGAPAEALAQACEASDVEMVVVGSRGQGSVRRALLGSVSDRLVNIAPKPVLVVR